ncbi:MAG: hypothetical protein ACRBDL_01765 [Alphaproteobacteria bacterium]
MSGKDRDADLKFSGTIPEADKGPDYVSSNFKARSQGEITQNRLDKALTDDVATRMQAPLGNHDDAPGAYRIPNDQPVVMTDQGREFMVKQASALEARIAKNAEDYAKSVEGKQNPFLPPSVSASETIDPSVKTDQLLNRFDGSATPSRSALPYNSQRVSEVLGTVPVEKPAEPLLSAEEEAAFFGNDDDNIPLLSQDDIVELDETSIKGIELD